MNLEAMKEAGSDIFKKLPSWVRWLIEMSINIIVVIIILTIIRRFVFLPLTIDGVSMQPTFESGEVIYVDRFVPMFSGYDYGDVVVFVPPKQHGEKKEIQETGLMCLFEKAHNILFFSGKENPCNVYKTYIKRIVGLPGDRVEIKNGHVFVTRKGESEPVQMREDFLLDKNKNKTCVPAQKCSQLFALASQSGKSYPVVPEGKYFVLGDNRVNSSDSRAESWDTPFVEEEDIIGITRAVYLSPKPIESQGSAFSNYIAALRNIPSTFSGIRLIGDNDIFSQDTL